MNQHRTLSEDFYQTDFYAWTQHQAKLLRDLTASSGPLPEGLDIENIAEEIETLGRSDVNAVRNLIVQVLIHFAKAASSPGSNAAAHWRSEAAGLQSTIPDRYAPSMRQLIDMQVLWKKALRLADIAMREHGAALSATLPPHCPYSVVDFVSEEFDLNQMLSRLT